MGLVFVACSCLSAFVCVRVPVSVCARVSLPMSVVGLCSCACVGVCPRLLAYVSLPMSVGGLRRWVFLPLCAGVGVCVCVCVCPRLLAYVCGWLASFELFAFVRLCRRVSASPCLCLWAACVVGTRRRRAPMWVCVRISLPVSAGGLRRWSSLPLCAYVGVCGPAPPCLCLWAACVVGALCRRAPMSVCVSASLCLCLWVACVVGALCRRAPVSVCVRVSLSMSVGASGFATVE